MASLARRAWALLGLLEQTAHSAAMALQGWMAKTVSTARWAYPDRRGRRAFKGFRAFKACRERRVRLASMGLTELTASQGRQERLASLEPLAPTARSVVTERPALTVRMVTTASRARQVPRARKGFRESRESRVRSARRAIQEWMARTARTVSTARPVRLARRALKASPARVSRAVLVRQGSMGLTELTVNPARPGLALRDQPGQTGQSVATGCLARTGKTVLMASPARLESLGPLARLAPAVPHWEFYWQSGMDN